MTTTNRFIALLITLLLPFTLSAAVETRAALDVGSGMTKMAVADVDVDSQTIIKVHHSEAVVVPLKNLDSDGNIPDETVEQLFVVLESMVTKARAYGATSFAAVGTEALRKAGNGQAVLDAILNELGLHVLMLPQDDEALIGYLSAVACAEPAEGEEVVVLDIGWGSTQFATMKQKVLISDGFDMGFLVVEGIWQALYGKETPMFPFNGERVQEMVDHLDGLFHSNTFAGTHTVRYGLSAMCTVAQLLDKDPLEPISASEIKEALTILGQMDPEDRTQLLSRFSTESFPVYALVTLLAVMEYNDIEYAHYYEGPVGNTAGMLIYNGLWSVQTTSVTDTP